MPEERVLRLIFIFHLFMTSDIKIDRVAAFTGEEQGFLRYALRKWAVYERHGAWRAHPLAFSSNFNH